MDGELALEILLTSCPLLLSILSALGSGSSAESRAAWRKIERERDQPCWNREE